MKEIIRSPSIIKAVALPFIFILLSGCTEEPRISRLQQDIQSAKSELAELQKQIEDIQRQRQFDQLFVDIDRIAFLTPGSEGYSTIRFDLGVLTVSIRNVIQYANGTKVTLQFGNPLSSTINGLHAKIEYGTVDEKGTPQNETAKSKEVIFNESLKSGTWTSVSVVLEGIPSERLGFVRLRDVSHRGISLIK